MKLFTGMTAFRRWVAAAGLFLFAFENSPLEAFPADSLAMQWSFQYRTMYNFSNLPGPGGTSLARTKAYDFFRQRFRIGLDVQPAAATGGYVELEFRNSWGVGSGVSDARERQEEFGLRNVGFNRLSSRGLRYAFIYTGDPRKTLQVGILPLSDRFADVLFSADWDFNVGGIVLETPQMRAGYVRLVEGLAIGTLKQDGHLLVVDWQRQWRERTQLGIHFYHFQNEVVATGRNRESYAGMTITRSFHQSRFSAFLLANFGQLGSQNHLGIAARLALEIPVIGGRLKAHLLYSTGDEQGEVNRQFVTLESLLGTGGYWSYAHIFTPNGPSDVNDLNLDVGGAMGPGDRAGLLTPQVAMVIPNVIPNTALEGGFCVFWSDRPRNGSNAVGAEISCGISHQLTEALIWDFGAAYAYLGPFWGERQSGLFEIFSRLQLEF